MSFSLDYNHSFEKLLHLILKTYGIESEILEFAFLNMDDSYSLYSFDCQRFKWLNNKFEFNYESNLSGLKNKNFVVFSEQPLLGSMILDGPIVYMVFGKEQELPKSVLIFSVPKDLTDNLQLEELFFYFEPIFNWGNLNPSITPFKHEIGQEKVLTLLNEVSLAVSNSFDEDQLVIALKNCLNPKMDRSRFLLLLCDEDMSSLNIKLLMEDTNLAAGGKNILKEGDIFLLNDYPELRPLIRLAKKNVTENLLEEGPHFNLLDGKFKSRLILPLKTQEDVLGFVFIYSDEVTAFPKERESFYEILGNLISISLSSFLILKEMYFLNETLTSKMGSYQEESQTFNKEKKKPEFSPLAKGGLIYKSKIMEKLNYFIERAGKTSASILIQGESGTGKELIAHAIHKSSNREKGPYITINCGAVPENLLESELFGYERGAFTGADKNKPGLVSIANGGTLFMDEVGEMSLNTQKKLLRFLQEKEFLPLGSSKVHKADVRVVTATNKDLELEVAESRFRQDLYFRINTLIIEVPALRERRDDIVILCKHFLLKHEGKGKVIPKKLLSSFKEYPWPGNVRELENIIRRLIILSEGKELSEENLPKYFKNIEKKPFGRVEEKIIPLKDLEVQHIKNALSHFPTKKDAAKALGISLKTLYNKLNL